MDRIENGNASLLVEARIRRQIIKGEIPAGTWVRESHLAEELQVSRTPVREALSRVASAGLLRWSQRRGYMAPEPDPEELAAAYPVIINLEILALETTRLLPDSAQDEVAAYNRGLAGDDRDPFTEYEADFNWHVALVRVAGNPILAEIHERLLIKISRYLYAYWRHREDRTQSSSEHDAILEAMRQGDTQLAVALLRTHRTNGLKRIESLLDFTNLHLPNQIP